MIILSVNADSFNGKEVYLQNCASCHSVNMSGGSGKDFNIVSYKRNIQDIKEYIKDPTKMFRRFGYSANAMPKLPLDEKEIDAVASYIDSLQTFKEWMKKTN